MTDRTNQDLSDLFDARLVSGIRELDGIDTPPDVADEVAAALDREADGWSDARPRRAFAAAAAAATVLLGLGVAVTVWLSADRATPNGTAPERWTALAQGDTTGGQRSNPLGLPEPTVVRSRADIESLPLDTRHVQCLGLAPADVESLQRLPKLRGLVLGTRNEIGVAEFGLTGVARLGTLESLVIEHELWNHKVTELDVLASLPALRHLVVNGAVIDDRVVRRVAAAGRLRSLELRGMFGCGLDGMKLLGDKLGGLQRLVIEPMPVMKLQFLEIGRREPLDDAKLLALRLDRLRELVLRNQHAPTGEFLAELSRAPLETLVLANCHGIEAASLGSLPASLAHLDLSSTRVDKDAIRRLVTPALRTLSLRNCKAIDAEMAGLVGRWRGCRITTPSGATVRIARDGRCESVPVRIVLTQRLDNGPYRTAAYSFHHASADVGYHRNNVDLLYDRCGLIHVNAHGNSNNGLIDLGEGPIGAIGTVPADGWLTDSFRPIAGHVYLQQVQWKSEAAPVMIRFEIDDVGEGKVSLSWTHLEAANVWRAPPPVPGIAGTKGQCGGPHAAR